jgi:hypothetical protein
MGRQADRVADQALSRQADWWQADRKAADWALGRKADKQAERQAGKKAMRTGQYV